MRGKKAGQKQRNDGENNRYDQEEGNWSERTEHSRSVYPRGPRGWRASAILRSVSGVLPSQADKPRYVAAMFERIAGRYDLMNTLMTAGQDRRWRRIVSELASSGRAERILDVGTGTGRLGAALLEANRQVTVVGVDFAQAMLRQAPREVHPTRADALRLPFADEQFDAVVSAFVVRNLADVSSGIAEQVHTLLKNPELRERMGRQGAEHAQQYSWRNIASQMIDVYDAEVFSRSGAACQCV